MLKGKELGAAIKRAIEMKIASGNAESKAEIARHFDIKPPSIFDWINKGSISKDKLPELWRYFSDVVGADHWGITQADMVFAHQEAGNVLPAMKVLDERRGYPIISYVQAGSWREIVDSFPRGGADSYAMANNTYGPHTFALRIVGNSMEPEFRENDIVIIDPDVMPNPGDYVVARNHEEAATFKKYRPRGIVDGREVFELVPLNEDYAVMRSDHQPIQIIGTMVEHTRFRR
jgi:SOS-response transcriptional repressor LexA